jgi:hypothetical protein
VNRNRLEDAGSEQHQRANKRMLGVVFSVSVSAFGVDSVKQLQLKSPTLLNGSSLEKHVTLAIAPIGSCSRAARERKFPACLKQDMFRVDATQALGFEDVEGPHYRCSKNLPLCDTENNGNLMNTCPDGFTNEPVEPIPQIQSCFDFIKTEFCVRLPPSPQLHNTVLCRACDYTIVVVNYTKQQLAQATFAQQGVEGVMATSAHPVYRPPRRCHKC